ncbi:hypothetical protein [Nonomuraea longicatena]|uniref:hypothetical protein n=1 Tax=Nonomuraea longicatena TaxID=83682 RepID=UPI0031D55338
MSAWILIIVGCLLAMLSVVGVWVDNEVTDTDRYVENVTPLASDPAVQNAVANRTTSEIMKRLDVPAVVDEVVVALEGRGLPKPVGDKLVGLAGPLGSGVAQFVHNVVDKVVTSDAFATFWVEANRIAHTQLNAILSGQGSQVVKVSGNTVSIDLGPLIDRVKQRLVAAGLTIAGSIPEIHPTFELFQIQDLGTYQALYQLLNALKWALPVLALLFLAGGVFAAHGRRRALVGAGLGIALAMLVLAAILVLVRAGYLHAVGVRGLDQAAAATIFDTLVRFLKAGLRVVLVVGLVVAAAAFLSGPGAAGLRNTAKRGIARLRGGLELGAFGVWVKQHQRPIQVVLVVIAALVFVFWNHPTGLVVLVIALCLLLALAVVEFLGQSPKPPTAPRPL